MTIVENLKMLQCGALMDHQLNKHREDQVICYLKQSIAVSIHKEKTDIYVCVRFLTLTELHIRVTGEQKLILMMTTFGLDGNKNMLCLTVTRMLS